MLLEKYEAEPLRRKSDAKICDFRIFMKADTIYWPDTTLHHCPCYFHKESVYLGDVILFIQLSCRLTFCSVIV